MRTVNTGEYVSILKELTKEGKEASLLISGSSMSPFLIHQRDTIYFRHPDRALKRGDMVFYQRANGQYVMHRIYKKRPEGLYLVGDNQTVIEGPLNENQVFALVCAVKRKGKMLYPGSFWWEFFAHVWPLLLPVRPFLSACYARIFVSRSTGDH